jgi:hypothetical protein
LPAVSPWVPFGFRRFRRWVPPLEARIQDGEHFQAQRGGVFFKEFGRHVGRPAVYLDHIPDANLRLFAQIELDAALAGAPELQGIQRG